MIKQFIENINSVLGVPLNAFTKQYDQTSEIHQGRAIRYKSSPDQSVGMRAFRYYPSHSKLPSLKRSIQNIILMSCLLCWQSSLVYAQNFTYKSKVDAVPKTGFYKIQLTPELAARAGTDNEDLRLFDNTGKEIPYLLKKEKIIKQEDHFNYYQILKNETNDTWQTIVIQNENKNLIDKLIFQMKNADADRLIRLSGSNDNNIWFVVRDNFNFSAFGEEATSTQYKMITFPKVDYEFYKIEIKNKNKVPLNIMKVGYTNSVQQIPSYQKVSGITFKQIDSNKTSYLSFTCSPENKIDKIEFKISSPALFHRNAILFKDYDQPQTDNLNELGSSSKYYKRGYPKLNESFTLSSDTRNNLLTYGNLGTEKSNKFRVEIQNEDNEPLLFEDIKAYQLSSSLIAELKEGKTYFLYFGDSTLTAPRYDLVYFSDKISDSLQTVQIQKVQPKSEKVTEEYSGMNDKYLVWIGLGIVGLFLFVLTGKMLKNMKADNNATT